MSDCTIDFAQSLTMLEKEAIKLFQDQLFDLQLAQVQVSQCSWSPSSCVSSSWVDMLSM
jgi:hypothetical protein